MNRWMIEMLKWSRFPSSAAASIFPAIFSATGFCCRAFLPLQLDEGLRSGKLISGCGIVDILAAGRRIVLR